jgi:hypothetical protein
VTAIEPFLIPVVVTRAEGRYLNITNRRPAMYRILLAVILLSTIPVAFTQSIEVASCSDCKHEPLEKKTPTRILIKAKCALPDGTVLAQQLVEVDASLSAEEKRATAERACQPILDAAATQCEDLANRVEALKSEYRVAVFRSYREHQLAKEIKRTLAAAPPYCK